MGLSSSEAPLRFVPRLAWAALFPTPKCDVHHKVASGGALVRPDSPISGPVKACPYRDICPSLLADAQPADVWLVRTATAAEPRTWDCARDFTAAAVPRDVTALRIRLKPAMLLHHDGPEPDRDGGGLVAR